MITIRGVKKLKKWAEKGWYLKILKEAPTWREDLKYYISVTPSSKNRIIANLALGKINKLMVEKHENDKN